MLLFFAFLLFIPFNTLEARRSVFRKPDPQMPVISTSYQNNSNIKYIRSDWYLQFQPLFNEEHFFSHLLPEYAIPLSEGGNSIVFGQELSALLQNLYREVL